MAIFGILELEPVVQVSDKTRLKADKSFVSKDEAAITLIEVEPESGSGFIDITGSSSRDWYLDWAYSGISRVVTVSLRITTDGAPVTETATLQVNTAADDKLFSTDADLINKENDILKWVQDGRSSFLNVHRQARDLVLTYLDESGKVDVDGNRLTADSIVDVEEVREWAAALTLKLIFKSISNEVGDIFSEKARLYESQEKIHRNRTFLRFDYNNDGDLSDAEKANTIQQIRFVRR